MAGCADRANMERRTLFFVPPTYVDDVTQQQCRDGCYLSIHLSPLLWNAGCTELTTNSAIQGNTKWCHRSRVQKADAVLLKEGTMYGNTEGQTSVPGACEHDVVSMDWDWLAVHKRIEFVQLKWKAVGIKILQIHKHNMMIKILQIRKQLQIRMGPPGSPMDDISANSTKKHRNVN